MMVYLAIIPHAAINRVINDIEYPQILNSFAHGKAIGTLKYRPKELTLDSGAFTAWNIGKKVDVANYLEWAQKVGASYDHIRCINLDVIPGEKGRTSTEAERKIGMKESIANADFLRAGGLDVMEVFHQDEPLEYLDILVSRLPSKDSVLCISPRNDVSTKSKLLWHQLVLKHLVDTVGKDNLPKMHGLAVTSKQIMMAFPYFSVDSSSYAQPVRYGQVVGPSGERLKNATYLGGDSGRNDNFGGQALLTRRMIDEYIKLEMQATSLWASRGIVWN
jgi:hypothetical protein